MSEFPWEPEDPADVVPVEDRLRPAVTAAEAGPGEPVVPGVDVVWPQRSELSDLG